MPNMQHSQSIAAGNPPAPSLCSAVCTAYFRGFLRSVAAELASMPRAKSHRELGTFIANWMTIGVLGTTTLHEFNLNDEKSVAFTLALVRTALKRRECLSSRAGNTVASSAERAASIACRRHIRETGHSNPPFAGGFLLGRIATALSRGFTLSLMQAVGLAVAELSPPATSRLLPHLVDVVHAAISLIDQLSDVALTEQISASSIWETLKVELNGYEAKHGRLGLGFILWRGLEAAERAANGDDPADYLMSASLAQQ